MSPADSIDRWLESAVADAKRRGLPELEPLLQALARATRTVRASDVNVGASGVKSADR